MSLKKYFLASAVTLFILSFLPIYFVLASGSSSISLSPVTGSYSAGQTFSVVISVNPGPDKIDTLRAKLTFSPELLEIKNFSTSPIFSYQAGANGFDNSAGTFSWGAGTPGGITGPSTFGTITFFAKKAGDAKIATSSDSLALSAGENKFNGQSSSLLYTLSSPASTKEPAVKNAQPAKTNSVQPQVVVAQPIETNNLVETQVVQKAQPQNFGASLISPLSSMAAVRAWAFVAIILIILLLTLTFYKAIKRPILNPKDNNKKT